MRTLLRIGVLIGVVVALIVGVFHLWFFWKVRTRVAALRVAHKPITLSELNGYYTAVAAESNAAVVYARAFSLLKTNESFRLLEKPQSLPTGAEPLPVQLRESMEKVCEENTKTLEVLEEAARFSQCRYPVDYVPGWAALLPHLPQLSKCATVELCQGVLEEQKGDVQQAIARTGTIMRMAASLDSEPDLISVLIQNRLYFLGSDLLGWLLNHRELTTGQLAELHGIFANAERTNSLERAFIGERCFVLPMFDASASQVMNALDPGDRESGHAIFWLRLLRVSGFLQKDKNRYLERVNECEEMLSEPMAEGLEHAKNLRLTAQREAPKGAVLTAVFLPAMLKAIGRNAERIAHQRLVQVALAIEQYRKSQNRLPESLAELGPKFLAEVPRDPFDDEEIRYRKDGDGYVIYSIGPDGVDDGGKKRMLRASKVEHPTGDIIFAVSRKSDTKRQD